jgi:hypothetical protein
MAEKLNVQIVAWCHFYWKDMNPGVEKFNCKLIDRAFNQVLRHKISSCRWDVETKLVTSPRAMTKMAAIAGFEQQRLGAAPNRRRQHIAPHCKATCRP